MVAQASGRIKVLLLEPVFEGVEEDTVNFAIDIEEGE
jgi:hypothetical protein